jgi:secondary thiamine-phosphate synthase enzyme
VSGIRDEVGVRTGARTEFVAIDEVLQHTLVRNGWKKGTLVVYCPHTTAGVTVNEGYDPGLLEDFDQCLDRIVPWSAGYRHEEDNAAAHVKAILVGTSATLLVDGGKLELGRWQRVFLCEFDGPRSRRLWLQFHAAPE